MRARIEADYQGRRIARDACEEPCAIERGMRILGGKWTGSILWHLKDEPVRFNDLTRMIGGASKKMVSDRLRHLEAHGLITRQISQSKPVTVHYAITPEGAEAVATLDALRLWSEALPSEGSA